MSQEKNIAYVLFSIFESIHAAISFYCLIFVREESSLTFFCLSISIIAFQEGTILKPGTPLFLSKDNLCK